MKNSVINGYWCGQPISNLSREELIEALGHCILNIDELRADRDKWFDAGDPVKYILNSEPKRSRWDFIPNSWRRK